MSSTLFPANLLRDTGTSETSPPIVTPCARHTPWSPQLSRGLGVEGRDQQGRRGHRMSSDTGPGFAAGWMLAQERFQAPGYQLSRLEAAAAPPWRLNQPPCPAELRAIAPTTSWGQRGAHTQRRNQDRGPSTSYTCTRSGKVWRNNMPKVAPQQTPSAEPS